VLIDCASSFIGTSYQQSIGNLSVKCIESIVVSVIKCLTTFAKKIISITPKFIIRNNIIPVTISHNSADLFFNQVVVYFGLSVAHLEVCLSTSIEYTKQNSVLIDCASSDIVHTINELTTDCIAKVIQIGENLLTIVIDFLTTLNEQN